jgi:predicted ATPase
MPVAIASKRLHQRIRRFEKPKQMENPNLFVVTGGPGSGKTTVLHEPKKRGYDLASEVARQIIQEQMGNGGNALPWGDRERYTELMLQRSMDSFIQKTPSQHPMFSDRGILDTLCYARLIGLADTESIRRAFDEYRYASRVFLAPAWKEIYGTDAERKQSFEEAVRTAELMVKVYQECGYE